MKKEKSQFQIKNFKFLIFVFIFSFLFLNLSKAHAALLYLAPDHGEYSPGDTFMVQLRIDNEGECINAAEVHIRFSPKLLKAVDFSRGGSIFSLWIGEPAIDNKKGLIVFSGGIPTGYCGRIQGDPALSNILGKIVFNVPYEAKEYDEEQTAGVEILSGSQVFLNDGLGTQAELAIKNAEFLINPSASSSENQWLDALKKDKIPPESFKVRAQRSEDVFNGKYYLVFSTIDKQSGLDYFEILEDGQWKRIESPYVLKIRRLPAEIKVRALDKAGNERIGEYVIGEATPPPQKSGAMFYIFVAIVLLLSTILYFRNKSSMKGGY